MKCSSSRPAAGKDRSLPPRGAWIEIARVEKTHGSNTGRSPRGERGLKYAGAEDDLVESTSLPPRGAWIEITLAGVYILPAAVAPPAGSVD